MTIRFTNTFRDILAFCFYHYPRSPVIIGGCCVCFILISLAILRALPSDISPLAKFIAFLIMQLLAFTLMAGLFAVTIVLSMVSRRNKTVLTEHTITVSDGSFTEETAYNRSEQKWAGVQRLARTRRYVFIYVAQHAAHVVPRRAFHDDTEWDLFYHFCRQRVNAV